MSHTEPDSATAGPVGVPGDKEVQVEYEVRKIVGEKRNPKTRGVLYKVRWKGFTKQFDTWEPADNLIGCQDVLLKWSRKKLETQQQEAKRLMGAGSTAKSVSQPQKSKGRKRSRSQSGSELEYYSAHSTTSSRKQATNPHGHTQRGYSNYPSEDAVEIISINPADKVDETKDHPDRLKFLEKLKILNGPEITVANYVDTVPCPPLEFHFINDYVYRENVPVPDPTFMWGCECKGAFGCATTSVADCACGQENHEDLQRLAYKHKGLLRYPNDNNPAIHECNSKCKCNWRCSNTIVLKGRQIPLEIFKTESKGWGIRCLRDLEAGQFIDRYVGEIITEEEADRRTQIQESRGLTYLFDLDKFEDSKNFCVDGADYGGVTRFINHSCDPNLLIHAVTHNRSRLDTYDLALFTRRKVRAGEELTFEYVKHSDDEVVPEDSQKWPCYCGAKKCRGWLW